MSHELRTPLNAVIGFSDVLLERMFGELNERQDEYVRDIRDSGRHLLELINEILDLSKVEAGRMELDRRAGVAVGRCSSTGSRWSASAPIAQRRLARRSSATPISALVSADELKLKQVVLNLLTNAVKFTHAGGSVDVSRAASRASGRRSRSATPASGSPRTSRSASSRRSSAAAAMRARAPKEQGWA